jgi:ABC-type glutathione transport system ATPase component
MMLDVEHLAKDFSDERGVAVRVLEDISFDIKENEIIAIRGPSGCGKTTLVRIIAGALRALLRPGSSERHKGLFAEPHDGHDISGVLAPALVHN